MLVHALSSKQVKRREKQERSNICNVLDINCRCLGCPWCGHRAGRVWASLGCLSPSKREPPKLLKQCSVCLWLHRIFLLFHVWIEIDYSDGVAPLAVDWKETTHPCTTEFRGTWWPASKQGSVCLPLLALALLHHPLFPAALWLLALPAPHLSNPDWGELCKGCALNSIKVLANLMCQCVEKSWHLVHGGNRQRSLWVEQLLFEIAITECGQQHSSLA